MSFSFLILSILNGPMVAGFGDIYFGEFDDPQPSCGGTGFDESSECCCSGEVVPTDFGRLSSCCGGQAHFIYGGLCCGEQWRDDLFFLGSCPQVLFCHGEWYDPNYRACCGERTYDFDGGLCCGSTWRYDLDFQQESCLNEVTPITDGGLEYKCYPNGSIEVTNPNPSLYTDCMAVQSEGVSSAVKCTVTGGGSKYLLTGCAIELIITVFFSDRVSGDDDVFVGQETHAFIVNCSQFTSVYRVVGNGLAVTVETSTQATVTPSFSVASAFRSVSETGNIVYRALVGDTIYWTIDIPSDYNGQPTCTAYSGTSNSGTPSLQITSAGCSTDSEIAGDFENEASVNSYVKRIWTVLYVFKFYNSDNIFFECSVKICPTESSACDLACGPDKRSVTTIKDTEMRFKTGTVLHIRSNTRSLGYILGPSRLVIAMVLAVLTTFF